MRASVLNGRFLGFLGFLGGLAGCGGGGTPAGGAHVSTVISGNLYFGLSDKPRQVEVLDWQKGAPGRQVCSTMSMAGGAWSCDVGALSGNFVIVAEVDGEAPVRSVITGVLQGMGRSGVEVTPITQLAAGFAEYLVTKGIEPVEAALKARRLINGHFAGITHENTVPMDLSQASPDLKSLTNESVAGILLNGIGELAGHMSDLIGVPRNGLITIWRVSAALESDIKNDGLFDGVGTDGPLDVSGVRLSHHTLRRDLGQAILTWMGTPANRSGLKDEDVRPLVLQMVADRSSIFPMDSVSALVGGATFGPMSMTQGGREIAPGAPVAGQFVVQVPIDDPAGLKSVTAAIGMLSNAVDGNESENPKVAQFTIDTTRLPDGPAWLQITAIDGAGDTSTTAVAFTADNTPPMLAVSASGVVNQPQLHITGTAMDMIGPVVHLEVRGVQPAVEVDHPSQMIDLVVPIPCNQTTMLDVVATDAAGNQADQKLTVMCGDKAPTLQWVPTVFLQEDQLVPTYAADGSSLSYAWGGGAAPQRVTIDAHTPWPNVTFSKYIGRLDVSADDLPTFTWLVTDQGMQAVQYRYLINGTVVRDWTLLGGQPAAHAGLQYTLQVSYQTLHAQLGRSASKDLHRVEVRATDTTGNVTSTFAEFHMRLLSPPVWMGGCQIASSLYGYTLGAMTLDTLYQDGVTAPVVSATVRYLAAPPGSLAVSDPVSVTLTAGNVQSAITQAFEDRFDGPDWTQGLLMTCGDGQYRRQLVTSNISSVPAAFSDCMGGNIPVNGLIWSGPITAPLNDLANHTTSFGVTQNGSTLFQQGDGSYQLQPGSAASVALQVLSPHITFGGNVYSWPRIFVLNSFFNPRSVPPRYRLPTQSITGVLYGLDPAVGTVKSLAFQTEPYISGFSIVAQPPSLQAAQPSLPEMKVGAVLAPECSRVLQYGSNL